MAFSLLNNDQDESEGDYEDYESDYETNPYTTNGNLLNNNTMPINTGATILPNGVMILANNSGQSRKRRRKSSELENSERWTCPAGCGKFFRRSSTKSIRDHLEQGCSGSANCT